MRRHGIPKLLTCLLFIPILAVIIAEEIGRDFAESRAMRGPRCEHHDHDGTRPAKWLGKLKRIKTQYASSKANPKPKFYYGQPHIHSRPPQPQYFPPLINFKIPPSISPTSYSVPHSNDVAVKNPYSPQPYSSRPNLPQTFYRPQKNTNQFAQAVNYDPPANVAVTHTEAPFYAPSSNGHASYSQSSEDFEDLRLPMSVSVPPARVNNPPSSYSLGKLLVKVSPHSPATSHTEAPNYWPLLTYSKTTSSSPLSYTEFPNAQVHSPMALAYDPPVPSEPELPYSASSSQAPVYDQPTKHPLEISTEYPVPSFPSDAGLTYPELHDSLASTRITEEQHNPPSFVPSDLEPHFPPEQNKTMSYNLQDPSSSHSVPYHPPVSLEASYYLPASTEAPRISTASSEASYYLPASNETPYYSPISTEASVYFPSSYRDAPYTEAFDLPASMYNAPISYPSPSFSRDNFPSFSLPSFRETGDNSPLDYGDALYPSSNHKTSTYHSSQENGQFYQQTSFPRFNEFLEQMLRGKM